MTNTKADPIFTAYAKSAPLLDLQFYIAYAERHAHEYTDRTLGIKADMIVLAASLKGTPAAQKRQVWTLISEFRASIANWHGGIGRPTTTADVELSEVA